MEKKPPGSGLTAALLRQRLLDRSAFKKLGRRSSSFQTVDELIFNKLSEFKYTASYPDVLAAALDSSKTDPKLAIHFFGEPFPKEYDALLASAGLAYTPNLPKELNWITVSLKRFAAEINRFLKAKRAYERDLLKGDYARAHAKLEEIRNTLGVSVWYIEQRLLLAELDDGIASNKRTLSSINTNNSGLVVSVLANYLSIRAERNISVEKYEATLEKFTSQYEEEDQWIINYVMFILHPLAKSSVVDLYDVLHWSNRGALVDRYLAFVAVCQAIVSNEHKQKGSALACVQRLVNDIQDYRLTNLLLFHVEEFRPNFNDSTGLFLEAFDAYTLGDYIKCHQKALSGLDQYPEIYQFYEMFVKSSIFANIDITIPNCKNCVSQEIVRCLKGVFMKDSTTGESLRRIYKLAVALGSIPLAHDLMYLFSQESNHKEAGKFLMLADLNAQLLSPIHMWEHGNRASSHRYFEGLASAFPQSVAARFHSKIYKLSLVKDAVELDSVVPFERRTFFTGRVYELRRQFAGAILEYQKLSGFLNGPAPLFVREQVQDQLLLCYFRDANWTACLTLAVDIYLDNPNATIKISANDLFTKIRDKEPEMRSNISWPLLHWIMQKDNHEIFVALDNFLLAHGLQKPSELIKKAKAFDSRHLVALLHKVCSIEVFDCSPVFSDTNDLETERLTLCRFLVEFDPANAKMYSDELILLTRKSGARRGIRQIDESKVSVNIDGIKDSESRSLRETFVRFQEFSKISKLESLCLIDPSATRSLRILKKDPDGSFRTHTVTATRELRSQLFREVVFEVRDAFLFNPQYGLDANLSARIRHGILVRHIRAPLERFKLITQTEKSGTSYAPNKYWASRGDFLRSDVMRQIQNSLADFSFNVDKLALFAKDELIQVRTESRKPFGVFDFMYTSEQLNELQAKLSGVDKYEEFIDFLFSHFLSRTEDNLKQIQERIVKDLREEITDHLLYLSGSLKQILGDGKLPEIFNNITQARTEIQNALVVIAGWFELSKADIISEFDVALALETAGEMLVLTYPELEWRPEVRIDYPLKLKGSCFVSFVYILFLLLENIIKHAGRTIDNHFVRVSFNRRGEKLVVKVENAISDDVRFVDPVHILEKLQEQLKSVDTMEKAKQEGGTGYYKICNIIRSEFRVPDFTVEFNYPEDKMLAVILEVEHSSLIYGGSDNR